MTDQEEILKLLESSEDLTSEQLALLEEYQQLIKQEQEAISAAVDYAIGSTCAITFAFEDHLALLPAIVLDYIDNNKLIKVLILTPVTKDTVPCHDFTIQKCPYEADECTQSHGYTLPTEYVTSFDALGTKDISSLVDQLQYGKRVWCKEPNTEVWKLGNIIDQLHGPLWRVRLQDSTRKRVNVDIEHVMPFKSLLEDEYNDEKEEWSESEREETVTEDEDPILLTTNDKNAFGGWQVHTTGFAAKMMKKMGYVEGKGLGANGEGLVEPVQAYNRIRNENSRPGLGLYVKKKPKTKSKKKKEKVQEDDDMFGLMNSLLGSTPAVTVTKPKAVKFKNDREANLAIAKLRDQVNKSQLDYIDASEAYRRNKETAMASQFHTKLKTAKNKLEDLTKTLSQLERQVKQTKEKKEMYTF